MELSRNDSSTKTNTAFSLLALLLAASAFKDELKNIHLIFPPVSLFTIFIIATVFYGILLALYLILELKDGTFIERRFNAPKYRLVLDHIFLFSLLFIIFFSLAMFIIHVLNFSFGSGAFTVSIGAALGLLLSLRTTYDRYQYKKYLASLSEDARFLKLEILKTENYLATINDKDLRKNIQRDIDGLQREFDRVRVKQPLHPPGP